MKTLQQFIFELQAQGVKIDQSNLLEIKHEYRKKYKAVMNAAYNQKNKRRSVVLSREEDALLIEVANSLEIKPGAYIKRTLMAVLQNPIVVASQDRIASAVSEIARVGNNVNQIARKVNTTDTVSWEEIVTTSQILRSLTADVRHILSEPIDLIQEVQKALLLRPQLASTLSELLLKHFKENGGHRNP